MVVSIGSRGSHIPAMTPRRKRLGVIAGMWDPLDPIETTMDSHSSQYFFNRLNNLSLTKKVNLPLPEMYSCCTHKICFQTLDKLVSDESNNEARGVKLRYLSGLRPCSNIHFNFKFHCSHLILCVTLTFFLLVRSLLDREKRTDSGPYAHIWKWWW